jgi:hypothetical protein
VITEINRLAICKLRKKDFNVKLHMIILQEFQAKSLNSQIARIWHIIYLDKHRQRG